MVVALRRVHPYDVFWMHGQPDAIARDTLFKGPPCRPRCPRWVTQAALTAVMARHPSRRTARGLRIVGFTMVAGYLGERLVRQRLRPAGWDALELHLIIAAWALGGDGCAWQLEPGLRDESEASTMTRVPLVAAS